MSGAPAGRTRGMRATTLLAAVVAALAAAFAVTLPASDPDLFWHLASGDWMLDHGRLLDHDVFSFTRAGAPYASGQWLGQLALALAFRAGGWVGIDVLRAALVGTGAFFLARAVLRVQPHPAWATPPLLVTLLVTKTVWGDRPQLFTLALFPLVLDLLLAARLDGRLRRLALVPPLLVLWANLHGAFPAGLALVAVFTIEAALARARWRPFALALAAAALASQLNPASGRALGWAVGYVATSWGYIVEERPPDILTGPGLAFAALLLAALASALALGREGVGRALGAPLLWPGLVVPFALLGLAIQRQLPLACVVLAPFVAGAVPAALGRVPGPGAAPALGPASALGRVPALAPLVPRRLGVLAALALAGAVGATAALAAARAPDLTAYPAGALPALRAASGNLLNEYDWGGFLIREAPEHPVFLDGRGALLYVPGVLDEFERAVRLRPGFRAPLVEHDIRLALLRPERPLVEALRGDGWRTLASGDRFVLLERP